MKEYKRSLFRVILDVVIAALVIFVAFVVGYYLLPKYVVYITIVVALGAIGLFLIDGRIKFCLNQNELTYYRRGKLIHTYHLTSETDVRVKTVRDGMTYTELALLIDDDYIDCLPLGYFTFSKLYDDIIEIVGEKVHKLKVEKRK